MSFKTVVIPRLLSIVALMLAAAPAAEAAQFEVGKPFPAMAFPDLDGHPKSMSDFLGKKTVLHIFASW